jgi:hypothetical protein
MLPIRLLALIVVVFFSIALVPGVIKVPERVQRKMPKPMAIAEVPDWPKLTEAPLHSAEGQRHEQSGTDLTASLPESSEQAAIPAEQVETPIASKVEEETMPTPRPQSAVNPTYVGSDVVANELERYDVTGSIKPSAPALGNADHVTENLSTPLAARTAPKPTVRKVIRHAARAAPGSGAGAFAHKFEELSPPNFTNSAY